MKTALVALLLLFPHALSPTGGVDTKYKRFLIKQVRFIWGIDYDVSIFAAQIRQESNWNPRARSPFAVGLSQFTPRTAMWISSQFQDLNNHNPIFGDIRYDWKWSIKAMVRYDAFLFERIERRHVRQSQRWPLTLRAYNGGIGWIYRELGSCEKIDYECCLRFRNAKSCGENHEYPRLILIKWKPLYEGWNR